MRNVKTIISAVAVLLLILPCQPDERTGCSERSWKIQTGTCSCDNYPRKILRSCHSEDGSTLAKMHINFTK